MNKENIHLVIEWINQNDLDGFIIPHDDEFMSEYLPLQNERLAWATGFTGSAGVAVVLKDKAAIFVDGRYTVQVQQQVNKEHFEILHLISDPYLDWIINNIDNGAKIGFDPKLHSHQWFNSTYNKTRSYFTLVPQEINPVDYNWKNRQERKYSEMLLLSEEYTGESSSSKRNVISNEIEDRGCDATIITRLDSIAWLLNIRGSDVPCNPVLLSYGILLSNGNFKLFIDNEIPSNFMNHVGNNVDIFSMDKFESQLNLLKNKTIWFDPTSNQWIAKVLNNIGCTLLLDGDPSVLPKACKNPIEIEGMKNCHIRDGVAVCEFLSWLENQKINYANLDEGILSDKLESFRAKKENFKGLSFSTISASGGNAAMCHYNHNNQDLPGKLINNSVYLVDSGGQYLDGTTDITRTVAIGNISNDIKKAFTLVLKGHIALGSAIFPDGTSGIQLDSLARQFLWNEGLNYDHGTGHGVGCFLNVHEGPQGISQKGSAVPLEIGMVISNEPGHYLENQYGIRCENLVFVKESTKKSYFTFEDLTMVPFDKKLIDISLLTDNEIDWINNYHLEVNKKISPFLKGEALSWLDVSTSKLER